MQAAEPVDDEEDGDVAALLAKLQKEETLQKMTAEERAAWQERRWARMERRLERLRARNKAGRITAEEKSDLERLEQFKKHHTRLILQPLAPVSVPARPLRTDPAGR